MFHTLTYTRYLLGQWSVSVHTRSMSVSMGEGGKFKNVSHAYFPLWVNVGERSVLEGFTNINSTVCVWGKEVSSTIQTHRFLYVRMCVGELSSRKMYGSKRQPTVLSLNEPQSSTQF